MPGARVPTPAEPPSVRHLGGDLATALRTAFRRASAVEHRVDEVEAATRGLRTVGKRFRELAETHGEMWADPTAQVNVNPAAARRMAAAVADHLLACAVAYERAAADAERWRDDVITDLRRVPAAVLNAAATRR